MKRMMIVAAAALVIAGMTAPSFAHVTKRKHMHKKPVAAKTITKKDEAKAHFQAARDLEPTSLLGRRAADVLRAMGDGG